MSETDPTTEFEERNKKLYEGKVNRRKFLHSVKILGLSVGVAEIMTACNVQDTPTPYPTAYQPYVDDPTLVSAGVQYQGVLSGQPATGKSESQSESSQPSSSADAAPTLRPPKKISWLCVACGNKFQNVELLKAHAVEMHSKRLPEVRRVEKPTYSDYITGPVPRFDEKNTCFSRSIWDEAYIMKVKQAVGKFMAKVEKYSPEQKMEMLEGQALVAGAIYVDDTAGSLHEKYTGYMGHMDEVGGLYGWDDPVNPNQLPVDDPALMSEKIKKVARFYGADLVGITKVNHTWLYENYFERASGKTGPVVMPYPFAIVMAVEMSWDEINQSPKYPASAAAALGYSRMAEVASSLAKYIRALGYPALASGNDTGQNIPLAIDAGLGEHGRNGLLLTPEFGPRQRLCKVFTSIPLVSDQPVDFGIISYCEQCHACASACPSNAITMGDRTDQPTSISNRTGIKKWTVNVSDCMLFWRENGTDCGNCIAACPWALRSIRDWLEI